MGPSEFEPNRTGGHGGTADVAGPLFSILLLSCSPLLLAHARSLSPSSISPLPLQIHTMKDGNGNVVELYVPRKCSWTNKLITAKDHRSVQINIGHLDESGLYTGSFSAFALTGQVRAKGDADSAMDILWSRKRAELGQ